MALPPQALAAVTLAVALALCASLVAAQPQPAAAPAATPAVQGGPAWASLSAKQRTALAPLEHDWASIDAPRKQKWLDIASRFDRMSPDERGRVQQRMSDWVRLSPKQRNEARQNYEGAKALSAEERQERWQAYRELPEDQRRGLAAQAKTPHAASGKPATPPRADAVKVNTVPNPLLEARQAKPVAPSVVQARPGATTKLISAKPAPPIHQQPGLPKVAATPEFVDSTTLLPQRGPQGAATEPRRKP